MNKQPKALELAYWLDPLSHYEKLKDTAAELCRLNEVNAELLEALKQALVVFEDFVDDPSSQEIVDETINVLRQAIAKATGEQA